MKTAIKVAQQLCAYLNEKTIKTECDFVLRPIDKILRSSWYVDKTKQCGHTDCIYIKIVDEYVNAFFVVLEDGNIMTGGNIFINDAFLSFDMSLDAPEFIQANSEYKLFFAVEGAITYIAQVKNYDTLCEMAQYIQNAIKDEHEWVMRDR